MGVRVSDARRIPGNPLGGVLRATARAARKGGRRVAVPPEIQEAPTPEVRTPQTARLFCNKAGQIHWFFTGDRVPVVSVVPISEFNVPMCVTILSADPSLVLLQVWAWDGECFDRAPEGTMVHATAHDPS